MITRYFYDSEFYYTHTETMDIRQPYSRLSTTITPPENPDNKPMELTMDGWVIRDVRPPKPETVPASITPVQARVVMNHHNLRDSVEALISQSENQDIKDYWEFSLAIERNNPILLSMAEQLGLTDEQLDNLFIEGAKL